MFSKYFTLKEFVDSVGEGNYLPYGAPTLSSLVTAVGITGYPLDLTNTNIVKLWQSFFAKHFDYYIIRKDTCNPNEVDTLNWNNEDAIKWLTRFLNILNNTYPYYSVLLTNYANEEAHLMDKVSASTTSKTGFNDTPQQPNESGDYESTDFLTNFQKTTGTQESELNPKIIRLKEIQDNYKRVMSDWVLEYDTLVMFVERS